MINWWIFAFCILGTNGLKQFSRNKWKGWQKWENLKFCGFICGSETRWVSSVKVWWIIWGKWFQHVPSVCHDDYTTWCIHNCIYVTSYTIDIHSHTTHWADRISALLPSAPNCLCTWWMSSKPELDTFSIFLF